MNESVALDLQDVMLDRAIAGDTEALETLIAANHQQLLELIDRLFPDKLKGWVEISDILQETYTVAFRNIGSFHPQGKNSFYRWLATIARTRIADQLKAAQRFKRRGATLKPVLQATSDLLNRLAMYKRTPSESAARHELFAAVQKSIELLPEDYRRIIRLRHDQQLSPTEAAQQMNRSLGATQMIYNRALKTLRETLCSMSLSV